MQDGVGRPQEGLWIQCKGVRHRVWLDGVWEEGACREEGARRERRVGEGQLELEVSAPGGRTGPHRPHRG